MTLNAVALPSVGVSIGRGYLLVVLALSIVLSGPMVAGYAVLDEVAVYAVLLLLVARRAWGVTLPQPGLRGVHLLFFLVFAVYMALQSVRGMIALDDMRIFRFAAMFGAMGLIAVFVARNGGCLGAREHLARTVIGACTVYFAAYLCVGLSAEWVFGMSRFDLQGQYWSGTATAVFPISALFAALIADPAARTRAGAVAFWVAYPIASCATFYYQSRSGWLATLLFLLVGAPLLGVRRFLGAVAVFLSFVVLFPWHHEQLITPAGFARDVLTALGDVPDGGVRYKLTRISEAMFSAAIHPAPVVKRESTESVRSAPVRSAGAGDARAVASVSIEGNVPSAADVDRWVAIAAAMTCLKEGGVVRLLFGTGYYTHRYEMIPCIREMAPRYNYRPPPGYATIVRPATFSAMLVDCGVVGVVLFGLLLAVSALRALCAPGLAKYGILAGLLFVAFSIFVSLNYDVVLLYLMVMPGGVLMALLPSSDALAGE